MNEKIKRRPALKGTFAVLVVPSNSVYQTEVTIPTTVYPTNGHLPVVAKAEYNSVEASPWAFSKENSRKTVKALRDLADWVEKSRI